MNRIVLYGLGGYFFDRRLEILNLPQTCIEGITDSDVGKLDQNLDSFNILNSNEISLIDCDYIVITSSYAAEIKEQLVNAGIKKERVLNYLEYRAMVSTIKVEHFGHENANSDNPGCVLIMTRRLDYSGSSMAAFYAAATLKANGMEASIASESYDKPFLDYIIRNDIDVWIVENMECGGNRDLDFVSRYNHIIINTYWAHQCIDYFEDKKNLILWLHEPKHVYSNLMRFWGSISSQLLQVSVFGVSKAAVDNFKGVYPEIDARVLEYGIPDESGSDSPERKSEKIVFAIVGGVYELKGQDIFLDAIEGLDNCMKDKCEFWMIGFMGENKYCKEITERARSYNCIKIIGALEHDELIKRYKDIDVIVSSSREDMLPIAVVEGMMMRKKCIIPDGIGISEYVSDGFEVLKFRSCDSLDLRNKIVELINRYDEYYKMGEYAYEFYKKVFSMEEFFQRLKRALSI